MMPSWRRAASHTASAPVIEPVCEAAARLPASLRPTLTMTIGLSSWAARAASARSLTPSDSRSAIASTTLVFGCSTMKPM